MGKARRRVPIPDDVIIKGRGRTANGPSYIVDLGLAPKGLVETCHNLLGTLDPSAGGQIHLDMELITIDARKELCSETGQRHEPHDRQDQRNGDGPHRIGHTQAERDPEQASKRARSHSTAPKPLPLMRRQDPACDSGGDGQRNDQRPDQHDDYGNGNGAHEIARRSRQKDHRHEAERCGGGRGEKRHGQPPNGAINGCQSAHAVAQTPRDLVCHDNARVDQQSKGHDQPGDAHLMDRKRDRVHRGKACKADDRQDDGHDQRCSNAQGQQQDGHDQPDANRHVRAHFGKAFSGISRLIKNERLRDAGWQDLRKFFNFFADET